MKHLKQFCLILIFWAMGEYLSSFISGFVAMPGSILGMILLFLALKLNIIKLSQIEEMSNLLLDNLAFFFIPAGVSLIKSLDIIKVNVPVLLITGTIVTVVVMSVTGIIVQKMTDK